MQQLAPCPSQPSIFVPYGLVSLWDMLGLYGLDFFTLRAQLTGIEYALRDTGKDLPNEGIAQIGDAIVPQLSVVEKIAQKLSMRSTLHQIERMRGLIKDDHPINGFDAEIRQLAIRITEELHDRRFIYLTPENAELYESVALADVLIGKFGSARRDADEARVALALGLGTATVFHLMKVIELGIYGVRRCLGIVEPLRSEDNNWGRIVGQIQTNLTERNKKSSPPWLYPTDRALFDEFLSDIMIIKNAWRNSTMHVDRYYTPEEAKEIFSATKTFMARVAARCDEEGMPKADP